MDKEKSPEERILIVCIDRDDDLGVKTGIRGPVVGKEANIEAALRLALADPTEADANAIFGAVKVYDEVRKIFSDSDAEIEIVTITGDPKSELKADEEINRQLREVTEKPGPPEEVVLKGEVGDHVEG